MLTLLTAFKTVVRASLEEIKYVQLSSLDQAFALYEPKREGIIDCLRLEIVEFEVLSLLRAKPLGSMQIKKELFFKNRLW